MQLYYKKILTRFLFYSNLFTAFLYLLASAAAMIPPSMSWLPSLLCLGLPVLLVILLLMMIGWIFIERRKLWISYSVILISFPFAHNIFAFHPFSSFVHDKSVKQFRVVSWNVELMNYEAKDSATASDKNKIILDSLRSLNADVICLQEFFTSVVPGNPYNIIDSISQVFHYPYCYFIHEYSKFNGTFYSGNVIFSRYPIVDSNVVAFKGSFRGAILQVGLQIGTDTINIINTRLQSMQLSPAAYNLFDDNRRGVDSMIPETRNALSKIHQAFIKREEQANEVAAMISKRKRPMILLADLNDVPASYTYSKIKAGLQDAWLNKGFGIGRTFRFISPTLRIDYIFYSNEIRTEQIKRIKTSSSDHYGLVADMLLK